MSIKNVKVRFNLSKENDRKAYEYLQGAEVSYSKAVISAICGYMELSERTATEEAFLERVISTIREETAKTNPLSGLLQLGATARCTNILPKRKKTTTAKKRYSIFLTASKMSLFPAFDGTVMAIPKGIAPTKTNDSTSFQN